MSMSVVDDIKTISELKTHTREVMEQVRTTGRPVVVTVNGKAAAVLVDAVEWERVQQALRLGALLAEGEADVRAGRTRPMSEVLAEVARGKKVRR